MADVKTEASTPTNAALVEVIEGQITGKKWWLSKTFWTNVIMSGAVALQMKYGFIIGPELQSFAIMGVNLALRKLTKEPIVW